MGLYKFQGSDGTEDRNVSRNTTDYTVSQPKELQCTGIVFSSAHLWI